MTRVGSLGRRGAAGLRMVGLRAVLADSADAAALSAFPARRRALVAQAEAARSADELFALAQSAIPGGPAQIPEEINAFLDFARARSPRVVVEIGTQSGGTNLLLSRSLPSVEVLIGIDLFVRNRRRLLLLHPRNQRLKLRNGDSRDPETLAWLRTTLAGRRIDVLFIDGDHELDGVLADFATYRSFVAPGGLIAFHDIVPDGRADGEQGIAWAGDVPLLWKSLAAQFRHHEFVRDWNQRGCGIGVLEHDAAVSPDFSELTGHR